MPQSVPSQIQISTTDNPLIYGISVTGESLQEFTAERFINRLVINTANPFVNAAGEEWYMYLWDGSGIIGATSVELVFLNDDEFILPSGIFYGPRIDGSYQIAGLASPGAQGGRVR